MACDVCAVGTVVEHGKSGILVEACNSQAIADTLIDLVQDSEKCVQMGRYGREICEQKFSLKTMSQEMEVLYHFACQSLSQKKK